MKTAKTSATRDYDVVLFGATSFVGEILTRYLWQQYGDNGDLRWAIAGRSESRLQALRSALGSAAAELPVLVADAGDEQALRAMCERARVIVSTVGPYALYGEPLVKVCAETGTDYCDLCGEPQWIRRMVSKYHDSAVASGARIVISCGYDSIPSDMGVWYLQQHALQTWGEPCRHIQMRVGPMKGGISGGTVASMMNLAEEMSADPVLRSEMKDPYSLCPGHTFSARQVDLKTARYDPDFKAWTAPFAMSAINIRVVHRSNALSDNAYGDHFRYDEAVLTGPGLKGASTAAAIAGFSSGLLLCTATAPTRKLLQRFVVPKPGEGPSPEQQRKGFFVMTFLGHGPDGKTLKLVVKGDRDPGYGGTSKMLGQAASSLAQDLGDKVHPGGILTPASTFDQRLIDRLQQYAGVSFALQ
jgi:short subunit dehydrogenase-like uncharacterized protein